MRISCKIERECIELKYVKVEKINEIRVYVEPHQIESHVDHIILSLPYFDYLLENELNQIACEITNRLYSQEVLIGSNCQDFIIVHCSPYLTKDSNMSISFSNEKFFSDCTNIGNCVIDLSSPGTINPNILNEGNLLLPKQINMFKRILLSTKEPCLAIGQPTRINPVHIPGLMIEGNNYIESESVVNDHLLLVSSHKEYVKTLPRKPLFMIIKNENENKVGYLQCDYCVNPISDEITLLVFITDSNGKFSLKVISNDIHGISLMRQFNYIDADFSANFDLYEPEGELSVILSVFKNYVISRYIQETTSVAKSIAHILIKYFQIGTNVKCETILNERCFMCGKILSRRNKKCCDDKKAELKNDNNKNLSGAKIYQYVYNNYCDTSMSAVKFKKLKSLVTINDESTSGIESDISLESNYNECKEINSKVNNYANDEINIPPVIPELLKNSNHEVILLEDVDNRKFKNKVVDDDSDCSSIINEILTKQDVDIEYN